MKKYYFLLLAVLFISIAKAQNIVFPDVLLKAALLEASPANSIAKNQAGFAIQIDTNSDSEIDEIEAQAVYSLNIQDRNISTLEGLTYFINLRTLIASFNAFTTVDVSSFLNMDTLEVTFCQNLMYLNIKNGLLSFNIPPPPPIPIGLGNANFYECPNLQYVCCDADKINDGLTYLSYYSFTNVNLNSYCTFNPGGNFYTLEGNSKLDMNANGCDAGDAIYPNLKLNINDGTINFYYLNNSTGDYHITLPAGNYTMTPIIDNPAYFQISPTSYVASFPTNASPFAQDFCEIGRAHV